MTNAADNSADSSADNVADNSADNSADYEDLTGALRERVSSLRADELRHLIDEERRHDNRTPVIEVLESRLAQLLGDTPAG
jgi:hypothetical protein